MLICSKKCHHYCVTFKNVANCNHKLHNIKVQEQLIAALHIGDRSVSNLQIHVSNKAFKNFVRYYSEPE